jgi:hypothetical protein
MRGKEDLCAGIMAHTHHVHQYVFAPFLESHFLKGEFSEREPK